MKTLLLSLWLVLSACVCAVALGETRGDLTSLAAWDAAVCGGHEGGGEYWRARPLTSLVDEELFLQRLGDSHEARLKHLVTPLEWFRDRESGQRSAFFAEGSAYGYVPFVQRKTIPHDSRVLVWGDLHGSVCSFVRTLRDAASLGLLSETDLALAPNIYLVFLGDVVDRGMRSVETVTLLSLLHARNPDQVVYVRGNHEDISPVLSGGARVTIEVMQKFGQSPRAQAMLDRYFACLPAALFLGVARDLDPAASGSAPREVVVDWMQFSHGTWELGFNPRAFLADDSKAQFTESNVLNRTRYMNALDASVHDKRFKRQLQEDLPRLGSELRDELVLQEPMRPRSLGLMWSDFILHSPQLQSHVLINPGRGLALSGECVVRLCELASTPHSVLHGVLRAHQHNDNFGNMMTLLRNHRGLVLLNQTTQAESTGWPMTTIDTSKIDQAFLGTLLSAPEAGLPFEWSSYVILTPGSTFDAWRLEHRFAEYSTSLHRFTSQMHEPTPVNN